MNEPVLENHSYKSSLPILVGIQFFLTIFTLGYVAYFRLYQSPIEYPVVIVQPPSEDSYAAKFKGKVTIFDLADISEWERYVDPEASISAKQEVSFLYPPNFDIVKDGKDTIHLIQNNKDFLVISEGGTDIPQADVPGSAKLIQFSTQKKFYQSGTAGTIDVPLLYQGDINGYGLTIVDTKAFSPEVVYLILMSMDYVE